MPVQKKKMSKSKRNQRRYVWKIKIFKHQKYSNKYFSNLKKEKIILNQLMKNIFLSWCL
ncbi:50S ribosomal protein L32 [Paenibacillus sp. GCM10012307]